MPANQLGHTLTLHYKEISEWGIKNCLGNLDGTGHSGLGTRDSKWAVVYPDEHNRSVYPCDSLTYLGTDGGLWRTEIECTGGDDNLVNVKLISKNVQGEGENNTLVIVDWDGITKWSVTVDSPVGYNGDYRIGFTLNPI